MTDGAPNSTEREPHVEEHSERGTTVLALGFIGALVGMWAVIYVLMLERG